MEVYGGLNRGSYIAVHNTRIERLWRDVFSAVSSTLFCDLEQIGALNCENEADIFSLHYVRINVSLRSFKAAWNAHPLSTENHMSPLQLYHAYSQGSSLFDGQVDHHYGTGSSVMKMTSIDIPNIPLSHNSITQLEATINPLDACNDHGKQFYFDTVRLLFQLMQNAIIFFYDYTCIKKSMPKIRVATYIGVRVLRTNINRSCYTINRSCNI